MLNEQQIQKVKKYHQLASKNIIGKCLATVIIVTAVFFHKFFTVNRRRFIVLGTVVLTFCSLMICTSFLPYSTTVDKQDLLKVAGESGSGSMDETVLEDNDYIDIQKDTANLDDLMEQNGDYEMTEEEEEEPHFRKTDWNLILINKQHPVPEDYQFTLGTIKGSMRCDERIIEPLIQMFAAAKEDGINLAVCSPYRDLERQQYLFDRKMKNYIRQGMSYMDAYKTSSITVTLPGASEHQVGLAVDIICDSYVMLDEEFENTEAGRWLKNHSWEYGFILRYPKGKEEITGIQYEPWHFRYVGKEAASVIYSEDITLEELVESL